TPLLWAAWHGHPADVVEILLERKYVNPNVVDRGYGRMPLSLAVRHGHVAVVRMLLGREDLNPNPAETDDSRTPLIQTLELGLDLLHSDEISVNLRNLD
ncbi:hypothetical protein L873DRAFT_1721656, partial [Choiromyces venosus 120613-1]